MICSVIAAPTSDAGVGARPRWRMLGSGTDLHHTGQVRRVRRRAGSGQATVAVVRVARRACAGGGGVRSCRGPELSAVLLFRPKPLILFGRIIGDFAAKSL